MGIYFNDEVQTKAAHVINIQRFLNTTRGTVTTVNNTGRNLCQFGTYNKLVAGSTLLFQGGIAGYGSNAGSITMAVEYGGSTNGTNETYSSSTSVYPAVFREYHGEGYQSMCMVSGCLVGHTTTGAQNVFISHRAANNNSDNAPFDILNPTNSDDGRLEGSMNGSIMVVTEVLLN